MSLEFRAPLSTPASAGSNPIIRCPIWLCRAGRKISRNSRNSCRRRRNICASRRSQRLAAQGKKLATQYHDTLARIEKEFGVPGNVVLAIWARETDYGAERQPHDALQVLATQAYAGKRKEFFQNEFLHALKMLQDGVPKANLRSSWGGAMGLTQFLPSEYYKYAVDFDGDGKNRHLAFGARCARLGGQAAHRQRLAGRQALGDRGARAAQASIAPSPSRATCCRSPNGSSAAMCPPTGAS